MERSTSRIINWKLLAVLPLLSGEALLAIGAQAGAFSTLSAYKCFSDEKIRQDFLSQLGERLGSTEQKRSVQTKDTFPSPLKQLVERRGLDDVSFRQKNTDRPICHSVSKS